MPLTPDSFRSDPRRRVRVRALGGFYLEGREKPVVEDEVVELPFSMAAGLIHSNKAAAYDGEVPTGQRVPNPDRDRREAAAKIACCAMCGQPLIKPAPVAEPVSGSAKKAS